MRRLVACSTDVKSGDFEQTARNLETQTQTELLTITAYQKLGLRLRFQGCGLFAQTACDARTRGGGRSRCQPPPWRSCKKIALSPHRPLPHFESRPLDDAEIAPPPIFPSSRSPTQPNPGSTPEGYEGKILGKKLENIVM